MNKILKDIFMCDYEGCKKFLVVPTSVPCGHSICSNHIKTGDKTYKCNPCNRQFEIPTGGFETNKKLLEIIRSNWRTYISLTHKKETKSNNEDREDNNNILKLMSNFEHIKISGFDDEKEEVKLCYKRKRN